MDLVKRLKAAYDICTGSEQLTQEERDYTHFYLAVRSIVFKLTKGDAPDTARMNARVQEMIKDALISDGVEEIFKMGSEDETEQDIFDEDYLAKIDKIIISSFMPYAHGTITDRAIPYVDGFKPVVGHFIPCQS